MSDNYEFITDAQSNFQFHTPYDDKRLYGKDDEENDEERLTIDAGYVDPHKQIQQMILAGEQLNSYRMFDEEEALTNDEFAEEVAHIRHPNTDITEIITYTEIVNQRMQESKSEAERRAVKDSLDIDNTYKNYEKPNPNMAPEEPQEEKKSSK